MTSNKVQLTYTYTSITTVNYVCFLSVFPQNTNKIKITDLKQFTLLLGKYVLTNYLDNSLLI